MQVSRNPRLRLLGILGLTLLAVVAGWYVGSQAGGNDSRATSPEPSASPNAGQSDSAGEVYRDIAGRVVRLAPEDGVITLDHEEIKGFMPAMTMDLKVAEPAELQNLEPGQRVLFDLARIGDTFFAVRFRPDTSAVAAPEPSAAQPPANALGRGDVVPNLQLVSAQGARFELHDMEPRHKLITFFYARCPLDHICPAQSRRLAQLQQTLRENNADLHLVSLTLDASHDGPEVLAGYAQRFEADPARWTIAGSDDPAAIRAFADAVGARIQQHDNSFQIDHALVALRVDGNRIVDYVYGLEAMEKLVRSM